VTRTPGAVRRRLPAIVGLAVLVLVGAVLMLQASAQRTETGVVIRVDATGLTQVSGFTLRTDDGRETRYRIGGLENGTEFPPGHLAEHVATAGRVRVFYREEGGARVAYRLEDAPAS
jgi:hypothetical protein